MAAIKNRMFAGYPGDVSRKTESVIESGVMAASAPFGSVVKLDASGKLAPLSASTDSVYGFLCRPYPTQAGQAEQGAVCGCMRSGYMTVLLASGSAARGGQVYVRIKASGTKKAGDIEAGAAVASVQSESAQSEGDTPAEPETVAIPGCLFMGEADSGGNVEISYNI